MLALGALHHHPNSKQNPLGTNATHPKEALPPLFSDVILSHKKRAMFFIT